MKNTWYTALDFARLVWMGLEDLISGAVSVKEMSGPVGIVSVIAETGENSASTAEGLMNVAYLGAFIAINLAVMNLLPLPALDGGHVLFLLVNGLAVLLFKKEIPSKYLNVINAIGFALLMALMLFVTFHDIIKLL